MAPAAKPGKPFRPFCQRAALKRVRKGRTRRSFFRSALSSGLRRPNLRVRDLPRSGPPPSQTPQGLKAVLLFQRDPSAGAGPLFLSQAEKEPGAGSYLFSHFAHSALEPDRPRRLPLAGLAAKSFRRLIFAGVSRDAFTTHTSLISMPDGFTNSFHAASGASLKYLEGHNCSLPCNIYYWLSFFF